MRTRFLKYGKRMMGDDGQSEYFEASVECGPLEDPAECAQKVKAFVRDQLKDEEDDSLKTSIASRLAKPMNS